MKLFFDHNLSPRLVQRLADLYPNASHVALVGLERASDIAVWTYAQTNDYIIVTKDSDFNDLSVLRGFPPKVIWLQLGNCTTRDLETALRRNHMAISDFANDPTVGVLVII
jgi:predicted nuclease of predicted toxin-antitoxin system